MGSEMAIVKDFVMGSEMVIETDFEMEIPKPKVTKTERSKMMDLNSD